MAGVEGGMFDSYLSSGMGLGEGGGHQSSRTEDFSGSFFFFFLISGNFARVAQSSLIPQTEKKDFLWCFHSDKNHMARPTARSQ